MGKCTAIKATLCLLTIISISTKVYSQKYPEIQLYTLFNSRYLYGQYLNTEVIKVKFDNPPHNGLGWMHFIALTTKAFQGNSYEGYNVPFVGQCTKHVKGIIISGKTHMIDNQSDIYFKQKLKLDMGYNRVPVKIITDDGSVLTQNQYVEINIE